DEVADPADRVRTADRLLELADALRARPWWRRAGACRDTRGDRRQRSPRGPASDDTADHGANHSATSAALWMRSFDSSRAACSWTCVACSCTRMRNCGTAITAPDVCSITRSVTIRL